MVLQRLGPQKEGSSSISRRSQRNASLRKLGGVWLRKSERLEEASTWEAHTGFIHLCLPVNPHGKGRAGEKREREGRGLRYKGNQKKHRIQI